MRLSRSRAGVLLTLVLLGSGWVATPSPAQDPTEPLPTPSTTARIEASPNPVPAGAGPGSTTLTWTTGDGSDGNVYVSKDGQTETLFASGPVGSSVADWIADNSAFEFRLYSATTPRALLATVNVRRSRAPAAPAVARQANAGTVLAAEPNPVPAGDGPGTTEISWDVGHGSTGRVLVSVDGAEAMLFARGLRGSAQMSSIYAGSTYEFRLFGDETSDVPLASITVTRAREVSSFPLKLLAGVFVAFVVAALILRRAWIEIGPGVFLVAFLWACRM